MAEYAKKKNIRKPRPKTIQHADKGNFRKPEPKSKAEIAQQKSKEALEKKKKGIRVSSPKKHPAHDPDKGGGKKPKKKGAQATEVEIKKKPLSPEQKKKDKAIMKAEEARRAKGKSLKAKQDSAAIMKAEKARRDKAKKAAKKKSDAKRADIREEGRKPKKAEPKKQAETGTRKTTYEDRVKALVAKKDSLSKKETADGRSEYQVQMNKLKKENKKAWKKMFKGGKLKK